MAVSQQKNRDESTTNRHLKQLQSLLDDDDENTHPPELKPTSFLEKTNSRPTVEVVVFDDPRKRRKTEPKQTKTKISTSKMAVASSLTPQNRPVSFMKIRHEVERFGINGFTKDKKEEAKVALAIKLGAKPPKNKYINYKTLMEAKMAERTSTAEKSDDHYVIKKQKSNRKSRKTSKDAIKKFDKDFGKLKTTRKRKRKN